MVSNRNQTILWGAFESFLLYSTILLSKEHCPLSISWHILRLQVQRFAGTQNGNSLHSNYHWHFEPFHWWFWNSMQKCQKEFYPLPTETKSERAWKWIPIKFECWSLNSACVSRCLFNNMEIICKVAIILTFKQVTTALTSLIIKIIPYIVRCFSFYWGFCTYIIKVINRSII